MLTLAFDTATSVTTVALLEDDRVLGERTTVAKLVLEEADALLRAASAIPADLARLVVGTGPGSFTSIRIGLAAARGLALALDLPVAGVSTLDALASARPGAVPVIDARRREVFVPGPAAIEPASLEVGPRTLLVGDGACRYRDLLEARGALVPPDDSELHVPWARLHVPLAGRFGPASEVEPLYVRDPDADRAAA